MSVNKGVRKPGLMVGFFVGLSLVSTASIAWGIWSMRMVGETTANGLAIGVTGPIAVISIGMIFLAVRSWRMTLALRRGTNVIARWVVSPDDYATFVASDAARNALGPAYRNDWKLPKRVPATGLEVVFGQDIVMVGDRFFGLANTGMFKFDGVQILPGNPLAIEFGTVSTLVSAGGSTTRVDVYRGVLRIPVGRLARAEATLVLDHYTRIDRRERVVNPGFYRGRMRFGLIAAPICFLAAAIGLALQVRGIDANGPLNPILMVGGVVGGIGAVILAAIAAYLSRQQHKRRS